jgi:hypothetical protein
MKIFGKGFSEYVSFEKGFLILVPVVGLARLGLSLAGVPIATVKFVSAAAGLDLLFGGGPHQRLWQLHATAAHVGAAGDSLQLNHHIEHYPGN